VKEELRQGQSRQSLHTTCDLFVEKSFYERIIVEINAEETAETQEYAK